MSTEVPHPDYSMWKWWNYLESHKVEKIVRKEYNKRDE